MPRRQTATADHSSTGDSGSSQPLYRQVVRTLKQEIVSGVYPVDSLLPAEGELQKRFKVSRHTIREALRELRDAGLVASRQGFGTTVLRAATPRSYVHEVGSISDLIELADATQYEIGSSEIIDVDRRVAERLETEPGSKWLRVEGFRYAPDDNRPVCWTEVFVHGDFAGVARLLGRRPGPIYLLIEDLYGESVAEVEQSVTAPCVPEDLAAALGVVPGSTVIEVQRKYRLSSGLVCIAARNLYRADLFELTLTLRRSKTG
jgi:GntR family transcriptional regulator